MEITTSPAKYGETDNTLLLKIATLVQAGHGVEQFDPAAAAFFAAAGITDGTQKSAWNDFVIGRKSAGYYSKFHALFPLMGGTANQHKWDAITLTAGTFSGTVTHDANGITGDGSTGRFDTGLDVASTDENSISFGAYSRTNVDGAEADIGAFSEMAILPRLGNVSYYDDDFPAARIAVGNSDSRGLFSLSRTGATALSAYKNGSSVGTSSGAASTPASTNFALMAAATDGTRSSTRNIAFAFIAEGLSDAENADLYTAIQALQTALGREV